MNYRSDEQDKDVVVYLEKQFSFKDHPFFNDFLDDIKQKNKNLIFDLSFLDAIDSAGIGMLFLAQKILKSLNRQVTIKNPSGQVKRVLEITDVSREIRIINS